jgi:hypothetical protein
MEGTSAIFFVIAVIIATIVLTLLIVTKKGRNVLIQTEYGKIIADFGEIGGGFVGKKPFYGWEETYRLVKCLNNGEEFFVLECVRKTFASRSGNSIKITYEMAKKIAEIVSSQTEQNLSDSNLQSLK